MVNLLVKVLWCLEVLMLVVCLPGCNPGDMPGISPDPQALEVAAGPPQGCPAEMIYPEEISCENTVIEVEGETIEVVVEVEVEVPVHPDAPEGTYWRAIPCGRCFGWTGIEGEFWVPCQTESYGMCMDGVEAGNPRGMRRCVHDPMECFE